MANSAVFIGWGGVVHGREEKANQVFFETVGFFTQLQQQGEIESFEPVALEPHGGDLAGCFIIRGEREKLSRMRFGPDFQRILVRAQTVIENLGVVDAHIGEELQRNFESYLASTADLR